MVLTYDDGPEPGGTDRVLAELGRAGATATFFVLLTRVRLHPGLLAETMQAGHEIALHGYDHVRPTAVDRTLFARRLREARAALEDQTQRPVRWYRPPYGAQSRATWDEVMRARLTPVLWSLHLRDWLPIRDAEKLSDLREASGSGHIVLAHDGYATLIDGVDDGPAPALHRGRLTRRMLRICAEKDWQPMSLGDALDAGHELSCRTWLEPAG